MPKKSHKHLGRLVAKYAYGGRKTTAPVILASGTKRRYKIKVL